ncbi:thiol-disulfide oxidoreductase DCC family protein [Altibacter sp. HG106]|uniref:thiol-disulfide oxidoreductase DCC family protein n=1 Tax=Altibacter sp. HG106 TaxID=3023937 RepID=UPI002350DB7B|nr:DCC1-like thiol-disulfide oxidoreductase family protein [Altibacter sp. HG106]MDC7996050.1 DCC1-like thiol-disulfide oxidoreductase family protein [Altibacter sp. HG106]
MFQKFTKTKYPPEHKPVLVWDGECGFCAFWVQRWKKKTQGRIDFVTYQEIASHFQDIPLKEFKKASRLIEPDGSVFSGPDSAYRSYSYSAHPLPWHRWYTNFRWFTWLSDHGYNVIAKNRPFFFRVTRILFGNNPEKLRPYWLLYLLVLFLGVLLLGKQL